MSAYSVVSVTNQKWIALMEASIETCFDRNPKHASTERKWGCVQNRDASGHFEMLLPADGSREGIGREGGRLCKARNSSECLSAGAKYICKDSWGFVFEA